MWKGKFALLRRVMCQIISWLVARLDSWNSRLSFSHFGFGVNFVKGPVCRLGQRHHSLRKHMQTDKTRTKIRSNTDASTCWNNMQHIQIQDCALLAQNTQTPLHIQLPQERFSRPLGGAVFASFFPNVVLGHYSVFTYSIVLYVFAVHFPNAASGLSNWWRCFLYLLMFGK